MSAEEEGELWAYPHGGCGWKPALEGPFCIRRRPQDMCYKEEDRNDVTWLCMRPEGTFSSLSLEDAWDRDGMYTWMFYTIYEGTWEATGQGAVVFRCTHMNAFDYYVDPEQKEIERENRPHHWEETVQNLHPGVTEEFALAVRVHRLQEDRAVANLKLVQGGEEEE